MNFLYKLWIDLGSPSYISAANLLIILSYLAGKIIDAFNNGGRKKREQQFIDRLAHLSERISELEDKIREIKE